MFAPLKYLTSLFRPPSPAIDHSEGTEIVEAVNEVGEIIILEMPVSTEKRLSSPLYLAPQFLFEP